MMQKKLIQEFHKNLVNNLTNKEFLKSIRLSKKVISELIQTESWRENVKFVLNMERISCEAVLNMCRESMNTISTEPSEGWLAHTYTGMLHQLFPEGSSPNTVNAFDAGKRFYLEVLRCFLEFELQNRPFDPKSRISFLSPQEYEATDTAEEYRRLLRIFRERYLYEFMRIGSELTRYKTLAHISGVHYLAMHVGRQLLNAGIPVDIALVSGAAIGHDIGKYGCKPEEANRIPYLHYYYTDQYFKKNQMPAIGHIAANHSTWDLELENLSVESLVLIYSDFRVKSIKDALGQESVSFFNLSESFDVILNKLDDVDAAKKNRYIKVYAKLKDFEDYMTDLGINTDLKTDRIIKPENKDTALFNSFEAVRKLKHLAIQHNIFVMHKLNSETVFGDILEAARGEKNWKNIRAYINIFQEYFTYLTQKQKILTLNFLYELLMHREGDIRRQSADLIGNIIVNYDEEYRKELPEGVKREPDEISSLNLWEKYLSMVIYPDHRVTEQHKRWLGYTLKFIVHSVLERCRKTELMNYLNIYLQYYFKHESDDSTVFILMDSALVLPLSLCSAEDIRKLTMYAVRNADSGSLEIQIAALRLIRYLFENTGKITDGIPLVSEFLAVDSPDHHVSAAFLKRKISVHLGLDLTDRDIPRKEFDQDTGVLSNIFLENLKAATPWVIKSVNIELLLDQIQTGSNSQLLQIAAHLSNLIKVSERVAVRHSAGHALLTIIPNLTLSQRNEIAVELSRGLEIGEYEFSKYIPEYLGVISLYLHPNELDELILDFRKLLNSNSDRVCSLTLDTLGVMLQNYHEYFKRFEESSETRQRRREEMLGLIMKGLSNFREAVKQEALLVIGQYLFGCPKLSLENKYDLFAVIGKKMLTLVGEQRETELSFFNSAASLNHIYRFLSDYLFQYKQLPLPMSQKIAFFPGSFDPFSLGHKGIIKEIRDRGFEVYLAIDEFSWSRKTQPKMIRRQIISMSIADEKDVYLFPDNIPVNLANNDDLSRLKALFPNRQIYMVAGSDVLNNASSYRVEPSEGSIHSFPHIIFKRSEARKSRKTPGDGICYPLITGEITELSLSENLEEISSSRIRENLDCNRDISNWIEPLVQSFIYGNGLYLHEPHYKQIICAKQIRFEIITRFHMELAEEVLKTIFKSRLDGEKIKSYLMNTSTCAVIIRDEEQNGIPVAIATFHESGMSDLYGEFGSFNLSASIRKITSGKIIILTGIAVSLEASNRNLEQHALTEALAYCLQNEFTYAVYHSHLGVTGEKILSLLTRQGFLPIKDNKPEDPVLVVDMKFPVTLFRDIETVVKDPFHQREHVLGVIEKTHRRMQHAIAKLYPGNLVLSFDAGVMNHRIVNMIARENQVQDELMSYGEQGNYMCVPFGKILRGFAVPNTVTKSLHTEKTFEPKINRFRITEFPYYSPLVNQIRTIKSFRKPVLLVDDLLHKGYRIRELDPIFKQENVEVSKIIVGILSGRGKDLMTLQGREVESVYFIPNLKSWFDESSLYPFIGGDGVRRENSTTAGLIPSINLILPYVAPNFLMNVSKSALYDFSLTCLENAKLILAVLEEEYQSVYEKNLTLNRLSEVVVSPRYPDKGMNMSYDLNLAPSAYILNDIENLQRLGNLILEMK